MDWKSALMTFVIIFASEMGDKTQLMVLSMSSGSRSPQMVFFGAAAALVASAFVAVLAGDTLLKAVPIRLIRLGTGVAFVAIGALLLYRSVRWS